MTQASTASRAWWALSQRAALHIFARDQWVAFFAVVSNVATTTSST